MRSHLNGYQNETEREFAVEKSMKNKISASILYDLIHCPHRVYMDIFSEANKDPVSPFVKLLWENGNLYEKDVMEELHLPFTDLKLTAIEEREKLTMEAMKRGDQLIYGGRICAGDLLGEPDLLRKCNDGYVAGDIKSGSGEENSSGDSEGKPKKHYAAQLALYTDILERLGLSGGRVPFVWDIHGQEIDYDLNAPRGRKKADCLWDMYQNVLEYARRIVSGNENTRPAYSGVCKLCHWHSECLKKLKELDDLTLIPELGRAKRDVMLSRIKSVKQLSCADLKELIRGNKTLFAGIGINTLLKYQERAKLQKISGAKPYVKLPLDLRKSDCELFFDIETDPMRDICYLHGFIERKFSSASKEKYVAFFAESPTDDAERDAFSEAWAYIKNNQPCMIYYYSPYEKTVWNKLQKKYPSIVTEQEISDMFDSAHAIDLYLHVVKSKTEWPTHDYSIKTLATFLGFSWRDSNPSGAASIEWYNRWVETGDKSIQRQILEYNEDDCIAMRVLLDGIIQMSNESSE